MKLSDEQLKLKVAWLYPDLLQSYCDRANIDAFFRRATARDIDVEIKEIKADDKIHSVKYDFYYIGGTNIQDIEECLEPIKQNAVALQAAADMKIPMLAVSVGYILFSNSFKKTNGVVKDCLRIFDCDATMGYERLYVNVVGKCQFLKKNSIVGFINSTVDMHLNRALPFLTLTKPKNMLYLTEGAIYKNAMGTFISSPLLVQNPHLCDFFILLALWTKYKAKLPLSHLNDEIEWYSHDYIAQK